jgi:hypothetical protein
MESFTLCLRQATGAGYRTPRMRRTSAVPATKQTTAPPNTAL